MNGAEDIVDAVTNASEPPDDLDAPPDKPRLLVDSNNPDRTVAALRDILAASGQVYERGVPVRVAFDQTSGSMVAHPLSGRGLVRLAHEVARPYRLRNTSDTSAECDAGLPITIAEMYLDWKGDWNLPPLNGIAAAPLLREDGSIIGAKGFDPATGMFCDDRSEIVSLVPAHPTDEDAATALRNLRGAFRTFPFADANMVDEAGTQVVDIDQAPRHDESAFLVALLTAVCRPSLDLAPGFLVRAASYSGAGTGKGLLARCISAIAFGRQPHAVTSGGGIIELEKRVGAELIGASPMLLLDNLNNLCLRSDLIASAITERPARVRLLGRSEMVPINPSSFIVLTGNGLTLSEDLVRRFIVCELDPKMEDPEARRFRGDILDDVTRRRAELLGCCLTVWRWGLLRRDLRIGQPLGSFNRWSRWVRDPLLSLGCHDPAERVRDAKRLDSRRETVAELFRTWHECHGDQTVQVRNLDERVRDILDPHNRGRNYLACAVQSHAGTRLAGFVLTRHAPTSKNGVATYRLQSATTVQGRPDRKADEERARALPAPMTPMTPMLRAVVERVVVGQVGVVAGLVVFVGGHVVSDERRHRGHRGHQPDRFAGRDGEPEEIDGTPMPSTSLRRRAVGHDDAGLNADEPWSIEL